jgi:hypothetical protein
MRDEMSESPHPFLHAHPTRGNMAPDRRHIGLSSTNTTVLGGVVCLVLMAVYQAVKETHPDTLAQRHHGTSAG